MKENQIQYIEINKLKVDGDNPNIMTSEEMKALETSMDEYGFLFPVVVDQNNIIADGEHRLEVFKRKSIDKIPCYVLNLTEVERKLLRQRLNKLRGRHDPVKDAFEYQRIIDEIGINEFAEAIAQSEKQVENVLQLVNYEESEAKKMAEQIAINNSLIKTGVDESTANRLSGIYGNIPDKLNPPEMQGEIKGLRFFSTFYFDDVTEKQAVDKFFSKGKDIGTGSWSSHRDLDSQKLINLIKCNTTDAQG